MVSNPSVVAVRSPDGSDVILGLRGPRFVEPWSEPDHDLRDLVTIPGLADCHAHLASVDLGDVDVPEGEIRRRLSHNAAAQVEGGVLLVADKGSSSGVSLEALDIPADLRPELHMAGRIIASPGGYYENYAVEVGGPDLPEAVQHACRTAATWVKLIGDWPRKGQGAVPNYVEDELRAAVQVAHAHGRRVAIHTAAPETPSMAVAAGVDSIEHGLFLTEHDLAVLGARGGAWVPTIVAMRGLAQQLKEGSSGRRLINQGIANAIGLLPAAADAGVTLLAGTDLLLPHGAVAQEAVALFEAGLSAAAALATVDGGPTRYLGSSRALLPGAPADLVAFPTNPLDDIRTLLDPAIIVREGRIVRDREAQ